MNKIIECDRCNNIIEDDEPVYHDVNGYDNYCIGCYEEMKGTAEGFEILPVKVNTD